MNATDQAWADLVSAHHGLMAARKRLRAIERRTDGAASFLLSAADRKALETAQARLADLQSIAVVATAGVIACQPHTALDTARQLYAGTGGTQPPDAVCDHFATVRSVFKRQGPQSLGYLQHGRNLDTHTAHMLDFGIQIAAIYSGGFDLALRALRSGDTLAICDPKALGSRTETRMDNIAKAHDQGASVVIWRPRGAKPIERIDPLGC